MEAFRADSHEVMTRARQSGVGLFLNVGIDFEHSRDAIRFAEKENDVYATVGLHPHDAQQFEESKFQELKNWVKHEKVKAIGEIGLDYFRNLTPQEIQKDVFRRFVRLGIESDLPLVIHSRESYSDIYAILREFGTKHRGLMHCFSGNRGDMDTALELGLHISFAGPITYKKNDELRQWMAQVPQDRLLVETDAPYLPPQSSRGKRNEPAWIVETVKKMAEVRQVSWEDLASSMTENAKRLFRI